ncbi:MAG: hypothetical protein ACQETH_08495 [Candidatus Rifleibacteriota bacterium]
MKVRDIGLKPYLQTIKNACENFSKNELVEILIELAKNKPTVAREFFLEEFRSAIAAKSLSKPEKIAAQASSTEKILKAIKILFEEIQDRVGLIENGEYDELEDWDWQEYDYYDDQAPDYLSERQISELVSFLKIAQRYFFNNQSEEAEQIYSGVFKILNEYNYDHWIDFSRFGLNICEERARYVRAVYEASKPKTRLKKIASLMLHETSDYNERQFDNPNFPLLGDVINTKVAQMPDLDSFCEAWKSFLEKKGCQGRPARLLVEVVDKLEGLNGIARIARDWKNMQPDGYLYWLERLNGLERYDEVVKISKEALNVLEPGEVREKACDLLIDAGLLLNKKKITLEGKREKFFSYPCDKNLLEIQNEAVVQKVRDKELETLLFYFKRLRKRDGNLKSLHLKVLLMAGKVEEAFLLAKDQSFVGWSYGFNAGLMFGAALYIAADCPDNASILEKLIENYAARSSVYSFLLSEDQEVGETTFYNEILKGLKSSKNTESSAKKYFKWAVALGKKRVEQIVSNQHRKAYGRAALTLGAMAESFLSQGNKEQANTIIRKYYSEMFKRHNSFKKEVREVIFRSSLLSNAIRIS